MKIKSLIVLLTCSLLILTGCGQESFQLTENGVVSQNSTQAVVNDLVESQRPDTNTSTPSVEDDQKQEVEPYDGEVDYDLTQMSSTLVYSQIQDLMFYPDKYIGKTFRMQGEYEYYDFDDMNRMHYLVILDATGCCPQGVEFRFAEGEEQEMEKYAMIDIVGTVREETVQGYTYYYFDLEELDIL